MFVTLKLVEYGILTNQKEQPPTLYVSLGSKNGMKRNKNSTLLLETFYPLQGWAKEWVPDCVNHTS